MTAYYDYFSPTTWDEAVSLLMTYGPDAKILAGGTVVMNQLARGLIAPRQIISLDRIPGWDTIHMDGAVTFGAGTTYRQIERALRTTPGFTALVEAAGKVGSVQVRNVATIAGNFCHASPAGDSMPPLLALDASLVLYGPDGTRTVPADEFIVAPKTTALHPGEVVREFHVPALPNGTATAFLKFGRRQAMEISFVCVAARLTLAPDRRTCIAARIALGAVAPTPIRARDAERVLEGQALTPEAFDEAADIAMHAASPISDLRASADYRRHIVRVMVRRALELCWQRGATL